MPTYNRANQLPRSIESVLRQSYRNLELIVVDDGSTDESVSIVNSIADDRVTLVALPQNGGANAARNAGIQQSNGKYICFQDSDDLWHPEKLEIQVADLVENRSRVAFCAFRRITGKGPQIIPKAGYAIPAGENSLLTRVLRGSFISCQTLIVDSELLAHSGGFDEKLGRLQDWELAIRLAALSRIYYNPSVLVTVEAGEDSISQNEAAFWPSAEYIYQKHLDKFRDDRIAAGILFMNQAVGKILRGHIILFIAFSLKSLRVAKLRFPLVLYTLAKRY